MSIRPEQQDASELNRGLTQQLAAVGKRFGFEVVLEYPVKGGRLDVVWTWTPPVAIPGLEAAVPVVGFEIESSWRTRKHVKGDLLNLQDAGVSLGVIVIGGDTDKDDGLRNFAVSLVDRPGAHIVIWTAEDVRTLRDRALSSAPEDSLPPSLQNPFGPTEVGLEATSYSSARSLHRDSALATVSHSGKYAALHRWLIACNRESIPVTFAKVEEILGFPLPHSCRHHVAHWHSYEGSAVARAIIDAGWKAAAVDVSNETVTLTRVSV